MVGAAKENQYLVTGKWNESYKNKGLESDK